MGHRRRTKLIKALISKTNVPEAEVGARAAAFLNSDTFQDIPFHQIASRLWAVISLKGNTGQKEPPNRGTVNDISIVSTLMPYCDAMLIDSKCLALLEDIPQRYAVTYFTRMFSPRTGQAFLEYLRGLERDAKPELLTEVENVYGASWFTPLLNMYDVERERRCGPDETRTHLINAVQRVHAKQWEDWLRGGGLWVGATRDVTCVQIHDEWYPRIIAGAPCLTRECRSRHFDVSKPVP
jgi:hypothetical protein